VEPPDELDELLDVLAGCELDEPSPVLRTVFGVIVTGREFG